MSREERIRDIILGRICDDFEEPELLHEEMVRDFPELAVEPADVIRSLRELIELGVAAAWRLSPQAPAERMKRVPTDEEFDSEDVYFMATKAGIKAQSEAPLT